MNFVSKERGIYCSSVDSIDNLCLENYIELPDLVKIDVEGLELSVLKGMEQTIKKAKPIVFIALDNRQTREDVFKFLEARNLHCYDIKALDNELCLRNIKNVDEILAK